MQRCGWSDTLIQLGLKSKCCKFSQDAPELNKLYSTIILMSLKARQIQDTLHSTCCQPGTGHYYFIFIWTLCDVLVTVSEVEACSSSRLSCSCRVSTWQEQVLLQLKLRGAERGAAGAPECLAADMLRADVLISTQHSHRACSTDTRGQ